MSGLTRDGTAEPNSRDQILRRERGQGKFRFLCSADHKQDWQPYPVDAQSAESDDHTHTHIQLVDCVGLFEPENLSSWKVCVCVCGHHFQQIGHQPGMVTNPARGQLNWENGIFTVPVRA